MLGMSTKTKISRQSDGLYIKGFRGHMILWNFYFF